MLQFIKKPFLTLISPFTRALNALFSRSTIDAATYQELEKILLEADTGSNTTKKLLDQLKKLQVTTGTELKSAFQNQLINLFTPAKDTASAKIFLLVGINGSGKTTCAAKLAYRMQQEGKKPLLVAADTFRAAAQEQLATWATRLKVDCMLGKPQQDPAAVAYQACERFKQGDYDVLIIDTAGRLQTKTNLMNELAKIKRTISKLLPDVPCLTLLTIDAMLGQNSLDQARIFHESTQLDGIILTKTDGTGKGGIVFAIQQELALPIIFVSAGEKVEDLFSFDPHKFVHQLLNS